VKIRRDALTQETVNQTFAPGDDHYIQSLTLDHVVIVTLITGGLAVKPEMPELFGYLSEFITAAGPALIDKTVFAFLDIPSARSVVFPAVLERWRDLLGGGGFRRLSLAGDERVDGLAGNAAVTARGAVGGDLAGPDPLEDGVR
jgi:hypothetical protein